MNHLERALKGPNQWWKYFVLPVLAFFAANTIGAIPLGIAVVVGTMGGGSLNPENMSDFTGLGLDPNLGLALMLFPFIIGLIAFVLVLKPFINVT